MFLERFVRILVGCLYIMLLVFYLLWVFCFLNMVLFLIFSSRALWWRRVSSLLLLIFYYCVVLMFGLFLWLYCFLLSVLFRNLWILCLIFWCWCVSFFLYSYFRSRRVLSLKMNWYDFVFLNCYFVICVCDVCWLCGVWWCWWWCVVFWFFLWVFVWGCVFVLWIWCVFWVVLVCICCEWLWCVCVWWVCLCVCVCEWCWMRGVIVVLVCVEWCGGGEVCEWYDVWRVFEGGGVERRRGGGDDARRVDWDGFGVNVFWICEVCGDGWCVFGVVLCVVSDGDVGGGGICVGDELFWWIFVVGDGDGGGCVLDVLRCG